MEYRLQGLITIEASGKLSFNLSVYSKDAKVEYGMLIVKDGELVKTLGKAKEAWPEVKRAFNL